MGSLPERIVSAIRGPGDHLHRPSRRTLLLVTGITLVAALGVAPGYVGWFNHDAGWLLYLAEELVRGADLYGEYTEINPPLAIWVYLPPAVLTTVMEVGAHRLYPIYVALLAAGSLALSGGVLRSAFPRDSAFPPVALFLVAIVFFLLPGYDFGQREHLTLVFTTPYLVASAFGAPGWHDRPRWSTHLIALLGGVGFALKPHFILVWMAVEIVGKRTDSIRALMGRRRNQVVIGVLAAYGVAVLILEPDYLPLAAELSGVYSAFKVRAWHASLVHERTLGIVALLTVALATCRLTGCTDDRAVRVGGVAVLAFLFVAVLQNAGWDYHFLPATGLTALYVPYCAYRVHSERCADGARGRSTAARVGRFALLLCVAVVSLQLAGAAGTAVRRATAHAGSPGRQLRDTVERLSQPGDGFAALSTYVNASFPLVNEADLEWTLSGPSLWWIVALYASDARSEPKIEHRTPPEMSPTERKLYRRVIDNLTTRLPSTLVIAAPEADGQDFVPGASFDLVSYFRQDPLFDDLMTRYRRIGLIDGFEVYVREGTSH